MSMMYKFFTKYRYIIFGLWIMGACNFAYMVNNLLGNPAGLSIAGELFLPENIFLNGIVIIFSVIFILITAYWLVKRRRKR